MKKIPDVLENGGTEMKPLMLKAGLVIALSIAGYMFSQIQFQQTSRRRRLPPPSGVAPGGRKGCAGLKDELHFMKQEGNSRILSDSIVTLPPYQMNRSLEYEDGYLLPEFNKPQHGEFKMTEKEPDPKISRALTPETKEDDSNPEIEEEMTNLRKMVKSLQEKERSLEFQLSEYRGLKEQDVVVKELESHVKISAMEAKHLFLKIESLEAENHRLEAQLLDHLRIMAELESSEENIEILKRKLSSNIEKEKRMAAPQERTIELEDNEHSNGKQCGDIDRSLKRPRKLEIEVMDLRQENKKLTHSNLELLKKLDSNKVVGSTISEVNDAIEEANCLRKWNEELFKELKQSHTDHCADMEELGYLRWVNACLKYELKDYQSTREKATVRDLSISPSPKSKEKAKQMILKYAKLGHNEEILMDFDSEHCSSSLASSTSGNEEFNNSFTSTKNIYGTSKGKFFGKLKKLVRGKETRSKSFSSSIATPTSDLNPRRASISNCSFNEVMGRHSHDSILSSNSMDHIPIKDMKVIDEMST